MSSTNKTSFLGLSSWIGSDKPQRADFNADNEKIDEFASEHTADLQSHLSQTDREKFDMPYFCGVYFGNGEENQTIVTNCPFEPAFGFVYCISSPPQQTDFDNKSSYSYMAFTAPRGSSSGIYLSGSNFVATSPISPIVERESPRMNAVGHTYFYVLFR